MFRPHVPLLSLVFDNPAAIKARYYTEHQCFNMKYKKALRKLLKENHRFKLNYGDFRYRLYNIICDYLYFEDQVDELEKRRFKSYLKRKGFIDDLEIARSRNVERRLEYFL